MLRALLGRPGDPRFEAACQQLELTHADGTDIRKKLQRQLRAQRHPRASFAWAVGAALNRSGIQLMNGAVGLYVAGYHRDYLAVIGLLEDPTDWEINAIVDLDSLLTHLDFDSSEDGYKTFCEPSPRLELLRSSIAANPESYEAFLGYLDDSWGKHLQRRRHPSQSHVLWHFIAALRNPTEIRFVALQHVRSAIRHWSRRRRATGQIEHLAAEKQAPTGRTTAIEAP